jgi:hypothetical protein
MTKASSVALVLMAILVASIAWAVIPAFPASRLLIDQPMSALSAKLGRGIDVPSSPLLHLAMSMVWSRPRGIALWKLQADWFESSAGLDRPPDSVSQTLYIPWLDASLPRDMVVRARVMVPNQRLERP